MPIDHNRLVQAMEELLVATTGIDSLADAGIARGTPNQPVGVTWLRRVRIARRHAAEAMISNPSNQLPFNWCPEHLVYDEHVQ